ncbi:MAG: SUMF1/EgtB/PvdO family nonheme iron enzyme, partial [Planctomycetaceae bacterium]|nr:SUMF1/EgtB/PvdO family nonheme iron enzyme [Planctomycetaceae bacterium]
MNHHKTIIAYPGLFLLLSGGLLFLGTGTLAADEKPENAAASTPDAQRTALLKQFVKELVPITPGKGKFPKSFQMGSIKGLPAETPVHTVTLTGDFWIGKYEVPQNLYQAVMGDNPSRWKGPRNSAELFDWHTASQFCQKLTDLLRK